jgi:curli biogenesis system outer membrane secretion channel CsgG
MHPARIHRRAAVPACLTAVVLAAPLAAPLAAQSGGAELQKCDRPVGTLAVVEPQEQMIYALRRYNLQSPTALIRMMVQQSNCFQVVERGVAMQNMRQERELAQAGELQQGSNMGKGQLRTADFILTPSVLFSDPNAGGAGGALGGVGRHFGVVAAVAGGLKFKEAETMMLVADARSGVQVAAAQGKAKKTDFRLGALGWGGGAAGAVGGYTNTNEGKVVAASFLDNYNQVVAAVRADSTLQRAAAGDASGKGDGVKAGMSFNDGDVLTPKIDNVKLLADCADGARAVTTVKKADELVFLGQEKNGYVKVQGASAEGWVKKTLVAKK